MSGFKRLLVPLSDAESGRIPLRTALQLGRDFQAHVTALHVRVDAASAVPLVGEGMSGAMVEEMMDLAEKQAAERAANAEGLFNELRQEMDVPIVRMPPAPNQVSADWQDEIGREEDLVARRGRLCDLIVMPRPLPDRDLPSMMTLNAALMESGRPLLVTPPHEPKSVGLRIAIAWNGSAECSRAIRLAWPFLHRAEQVCILAERSEAGDMLQPPGELAAYLSWHEVRATANAFESRGGNTGEAILAQATAMDADLVILGAYTHSRLRQLIMGGVTRHVLHNADIPVLLAH